MTESTLKELIDKALTSRVTFPAILAALSQEGVESYHVDFLRNEYRYYAKDGTSLVMPVTLVHDGVAPAFSAEALEAVNKRVQAGQAGYPEFVKEAAAVGCAYYIVYLNGGKVRYFGRNGGEYVQHFPIPL